VLAKPVKYGDIKIGIQNNNHNLFYLGKDDLLVDTIVQYNMQQLNN